MPPSTTNLEYQGNTRRTMGMDLQRSEFEDFMNAYRPTVDVSRWELKSFPPSTSSEDPKVDLGRSIKKLIKRTQGSPSVQHKNWREGFQRTSETHEKEWSLGREMKPPPGPSLEKKARRPYSVHLDGSGHSTPSHESRPPIATTPVRATPERNQGQHPAKNDRPKTERSSAARELLEQQQQHHQPKQQKSVEATTTQKNSSKPKAEFKPPAVREEPQVQGKIQLENFSFPVIKPSPSPSPLTTKKKVPTKDEVKNVTVAEVRAASSPELPSVYCLVVSSDKIDRYLPPKHNPDPLLSLRIIQVPERKYHIILEFQESPTYEKPKTSASGLLVISDGDDVICALDQRMAFEWLRESHLAMHGMLLTNVEKISDFPYVTYLVVGGTKQDLCSKLALLKQHRPCPVQRQQLHFIAGYEEAVTVAKPPLSQIPEQPTSDKAGFIISLYQVNPGEDGGRFEQNWVTWTGARQLYSHVPEWMGLKRISIHKSVVPMKIINYALICEFSSIMEYLTDACVLMDQLRARCCGFIGIYRVLDML